MKYLLLWPAAGLLALAVILYKLYRYDSTLAELVNYLNSQKSRRPFGPGAMLTLCLFIVALGPLSLVPTLMDAVDRAKRTH